MNRRSPRELLSLSYRHTQAVASSLVGRTRRRLSSGRGKAAVLMYHRVLPDDADAAGIAPGMYVRATAFERQVAWLARHFDIRTLGQILDSPPGPESRPALALTFDDGWRDNLTVAWPILRAAGVRATIFLVRDWVERGENDEGEFLRPHEVRELAAQGMEFGAHTVTHPRLGRLDPARIESELHRSKAAVERWTGQPCRFFAYPFGEYCDGAVTYARTLFHASVAVGGGWWRPYGDTALVPRVGIHQDMTSTRAMLFARLAARV